MKFLVVLAAALGLGGCASGPKLRALDAPVDYVALSRVPFHAQEEYQCGPAALAMVLNASGVDVTPEALRDSVYVPGRKGSFQAELLAATRAHGRVPYVLPAEPRALLAELAAGNPVLVFQNLALDALPVWHYAVLIGYDAQANQFLMHSGSQARRAVPAGRFFRTWEAAGHWALVAMPPERIPASADAAGWVGAVSAFETLGQPALAAQAYEAATRRWPLEALPWIALGNAQYALGDVGAAERSWRAAMNRPGGAAARNNLANVLLERGCPLQALAEIDHGLAAGPPPPVAFALQRTRSQVLGYEGRPAADCAR